MEELQSPLGLLGTFLGLVGTVSAIWLSWKNARLRAEADYRQTWSQIVDDMDQMRKAHKEEIERLAAEVDRLRQQNEKQRVELGALRAENESLWKRVEELETQLKKLEHLRDII